MLPLESFIFSTAATEQASLTDRDGKKSAPPVEERQRRQQRAEELTDCDNEVQGEWD